ncbi:GntP family permease [Methanoculleus horonobensis]|jgi:GntP family gluconate:H+ symporter|uniref:GntP family permease n=1 Tax=Methanoculleus horonobensis TaxID=528314 RepID=UPI000836C652|nr:GntP family permease [Methanoculleus horonobensis]MDD3070858.1 GntP family permease [Methanoculleus horonobensis]MDD4252541.1 GntP family permease [Methanoculleus horonobensis]
METLIAFAVTLAAITVASLRYRLPPFLTLVGASVLFGLLSRMPAETIVMVATAGAGRIFTLLGIVIFCGVGIAQVLRESGRIADIVADIRGLVRRPVATAGAAGYLLSVPLMCGITSFVILAPILTHLSPDGRAAKTLLYCAGVAGMISYVLLYPAPVVYSTITALGLSGRPWDIDLVAVPLSLLLLAGLLLAMRRRMPPAEEAEKPAAGRNPRAWLPFVVILGMLAIGSLVPPLHALANINLALLTGLFAALATVPGDVREKALHKGTKNAGIIIFDLAGAGALGGVIAASTFPADVAALVAGNLPIIILPFVIAALVQAAQGSRVVTAAVTGAILATTPAVTAVNPLALVLMISAGAFMFSYVSDPFFWLLKRTTGDDFSAVVRNYTLPLSAAGIVTLAAALVVQAIL